ncbi:MAG: hypothetical protein IIA33_11670 [Planctomycetes bacterium]|nr:hypothetical protein [Planctomycetota bacterium]
MLVSVRLAVRLASPADAQVVIPSSKSHRQSMHRGLKYRIESAPMSFQEFYPITACPE